MKYSPVKIAVIDSGVDMEFSFYKDITCGVSFLTEEQTLYMTEDFQDECGHGTQCASIIKKYCPNALLYIIKIIDKQRKCSSLLLLQALEYLYNENVDIINISLSVKGVIYQQEIIRAIGRLKQQGKIINVAVENGKESSFPANVRGCLGIVGKLFENNQIYSFSENDVIQIHADYQPEFVEGLNGKYEWFGGNSKATALMTGLMGEWIDAGITNRMQIDKYLLENKHFSVETYKEMGFSNKEINSMFIAICNIIKKHIKSERVSLNTSFWNGRMCRIDNTYEMIKAVEQELGMPSLVNSIKYSDFKNCYSFILFLLNQKGLSYK